MYVQGDGEIAFLEFATLVLNELKPPLSKINGILTKESSMLEVNFTNPITTMDGIPIPNFEDYFASIDENQITLTPQFEIQISIEGSRGCWWGEASHCTFCGLNGAVMKYRTKNSEQLISELDSNIRKYSIKQFHFVDNILNPNYLIDFFPKVINNKKIIQMFFETKANLTMDNLSLVKRAGIKAIQPGIESFSDNILQRMQKGTSMIQNIYLLKACRMLEIWPFWNVLVGFPGEELQDYQNRRC